MVDAIVPAAKAVYGRPGDFVDNAVREYARLGAQKISTRSKIVELLKHKGKVKVVYARYDLDKGVVDFLQGERACRRVTQSSRLRPYVLPQSPRPINVVHRDHAMTPVSIGSICPARVWSRARSPAVRLEADRIRARWASSRRKSCRPSYRPAGSCLPS